MGFLFVLLLKIHTNIKNKNNMSKSGFDNEIIICNYINNKKIYELNNNIKNLITEIFPNHNQSNKINCEIEGGQNKSDLVIKINNIEKRISVKIGYGNSVHQEPIIEFIKFLTDRYNISNDLINDLKLFIWGDGTIDGTGKKENRLTATQFKNKNPERILHISKFMDTHKKELIKRFLVYGPKSNKKPDYIYYGNITKGYWVKTDTVVEKLCNEKSNGIIPIGKLTFQAWNRAIKGLKSEKKRGVIQIKWPTIKKDLKSWMKNEQGDYRRDN